MRLLLFLCLLIYFSFSVHICAAKDKLPSWIFEHQKDLYLGVSEVMEDAGLALLQAQTRAVLNFCLTQGLPFETNTSFERNAEEGKDTIRRQETTRLELFGFECVLEKLYANASGEYFVLCRVKQGKSNNKIIFSRDVGKKDYSGGDSYQVSSSIITTLEYHSYSESVVYKKSNNNEEIVVKVGEEIISSGADHYYEEYAPLADKEKTALKFSYNLQHSFGRVWIGVLTQIPLCNKEVNVAMVTSSYFKSEGEKKESKLNSYSKLHGKAEGFPFPLYCLGIKGGQLIMEAGINGIVENTEEQFSNTAMGEYEDGISACSDALVSALGGSASLVGPVKVRQEIIPVKNKSQSEGNKIADGIIHNSTSETNQTLTNFRIAWQQLPEGIVCICTCPVSKPRNEKEVMP